MSFSRELHLKSRVFAAGELRSGLESIASILGPTVALRASSSRRLADGTQESRTELTGSAFDAVCDMTADASSYGFGFSGKPGRRSFGEFLSALVLPDRRGYLDLTVESNDLADLNIFATRFQELLRLEPAPSIEERVREQVKEQMRDSGTPSLPEWIEHVESRVDALERHIRVAATPLSCFVSFQFSGESLDYGRAVVRFLELLGLRVITGQGYEPKPIQQKVRERLAEQLDLLIVIIASDRGSMWTRDEMARAQSGDVLLIPLVEDGASFDRGIFGDHEYIAFSKGHIADAFTGLLEGVRYTERVRLARSS